MRPLVVTVVIAVVLAAVTAVLTYSYAASKLALESSKTVILKPYEVKHGGGKLEILLPPARVKASFGIATVDGKVITESDPVTLNLIKLIFLGICSYAVSVPAELYFVDEKGGIVKPSVCKWEDIFNYKSVGVFKIELGNGTGTPTPRDYRLFSEIAELSVSNIVYDYNDTHVWAIFETYYTPSQNVTVSEVGLAITTRYDTDVLLTHAVFPPVTLIANKTYVIWVTITVPRTELGDFLYDPADAWDGYVYYYTRCGYAPPDYKGHYLAAFYGTSRKFTWSIVAQRLYKLNDTTLCLTVYAVGNLPEVPTTIDRVQVYRYTYESYCGGANYYNFWIVLPQALNMTPLAGNVRSALAWTLCISAS